VTCTVTGDPDLNTCAASAMTSRPLGPTTALFQSKKTRYGGGGDGGTGGGGGGGGMAQAATVSIKQSKSRRFIRSSTG